MRTHKSLTPHRIRPNRDTAEVSKNHKSQATFKRVFVRFNEQMQCHCNDKIFHCSCQYPLLVERQANVLLRVIYILISCKIGLYSFWLMTLYIAIQYVFVNLYGTCVAMAEKKVSTCRPACKIRRQGCKRNL